tara:strand:+ start:196 stop:459 length:264 start_codon:yes stop_codon:yes gene_type:complete
MKFELNESCILSDFEDGLLVLNVETGKYLELNCIAAEIIQYLKENLAIDEIVQKLHESYELSESEISNQVHSFIDSAQKQKIISPKN